jgi:hypothetical protein
MDLLRNLNNVSLVLKVSSHNTFNLIELFVENIYLLKVKGVCCESSLDEIFGFFCSNFKIS